MLAVSYGDQVISCSSPYTHTPFPFSTKIISVMNIQKQCICFPQTPHGKKRPTDICKQQLQFLIQNGKRSKRQRRQAMHPAKKTRPSRAHCKKDCCQTGHQPWQTQSVQMISTRSMVRPQPNLSRLLSSPCSDPAIPEPTGEKPLVDHSWHPSKRMTRKNARAIDDHIIWKVSCG